MAEMDKVMIRASQDDINAIDALAQKDGYETRSAWIRAQLRRVINVRKYEIFVETLPQPNAEAQVVPVAKVVMK